MREGVYYPCFKDFLKTNQDKTNKQFVLIAEYSDFKMEYLDNYKGDIMGAIVPFIVYNTEYYNKGVIVFELDENSDFLFVEDMTNLNQEKVESLEISSAIVILDGLSPNITMFLDDLFEFLPENTQIVGGGAGKMTFEQDPVIFSKENGIHNNAALIVKLSNKINIGIENGWQYLEGPFITTSSEKNVLKTLNFRNAFEVYKEIVEKDSGMVFNDKNFFDIAKSYPLGIVKYDKEIIVRDPILVDENNNLVLVGDIPQNSTIQILKGEEDKLIESSAKAVNHAIKDINSKSSLIVFDCISRSIYLGDKFVQELEGMKNNTMFNTKLCGALTLGEIANNGDEYITFYNKSCVVGVIC
jgi:hypothetical protein